MTDEEKEDWAFFINEKGEIQYNTKCTKCPRKCKQSYRINKLKCPKIKSE